MSTSGPLGVLLVNFGEPVEPSLDAVRAYLERIFLQNVDLEDHRAEAAVERARELAEARAPGLVEEYERIGGSPLNAQADAQAAALGAELRARGLDARTYSAFQFTDPSIGAKVEEARADGVGRIVALPVYPICGQSTSVAAIQRVRAALETTGWDADLVALSGWHHHPDYVALRVAGVRDFVDEHGLDLEDSDTILYFSVHGTPVKYLHEGNRYDRYVEEHTREIAERLGVGRRFAVGFQNHTNRRIDWTQPDNEPRIESLAERRLVVVPVSFMHEQSETLAELDHGLRDFVRGLGKELHRVPVPHEDPSFVRFLADLVSWVAQKPDEGDVLARCRCCPARATWCTNGARDLPPSPYVAVPA